MNFDIVVYIQHVHLMNCASNQKIMSYENTIWNFFYRFEKIWWKKLEKITNNTYKINKWYCEHIVPIKLIKATGCPLILVRSAVAYRINRGVQWGGEDETEGGGQILRLYAFAYQGIWDTLYFTWRHLRRHTMWYLKIICTYFRIRLFHVSCL